MFLTSRLLDMAMILFDVHENTTLHESVHILHESSYASIVSTFLLVSIERLFATFQSQNYEKKRNKSIVVVAFIISFLLCILIAYLVHVANVGFIVLAVYVTICDTVTVIVTVGLLFFNMRAFKLTITSHVKLSQRYQIRENIKVIFVAIPVIILQTVAVTVALVAIWNMLMSNDKDEVENDRVSKRIYNFAITLFALFMPIVTRTMDFVGKRTLFRDKGATVTVTRSEQSAEKTLGRTDGHFYFLMLKDAWK